MTREKMVQLLGAIFVSQIFGKSFEYDKFEGEVGKLLDLYMESQRVRIPAPKLKWEADMVFDPYIKLTAEMFGYKFVIFVDGDKHTTRVQKHGAWQAEYGDYGMGRHDNRESAEKSLSDYWESIWNKEVGADVVPAANIELHPINSGLSEAEQKAIMLEAIKQWKSGPIQFVPAADPFAGIDLDCEHFEDLPPSIMDNPVFSAYWNAANSHLEVGDSIWDAFKKWAEKYRSGGKQNG